MLLFLYKQTHLLPTIWKLKSGDERRTINGSLIYISILQFLAFSPLGMFFGVI